MEALARSAVARPAGLLLGGACGAVIAYGSFAGTVGGRRLDAAIARRDLDGGWEAPAHLAGTMAAGPAILVVTAALGVVALRDGRAVDALRTVVLVAATIALSVVASRVLARVDPLDAEHLRFLGEGWYPSGHAAAVMAVGLAVPMALPDRSRGPSVLAAAGMWPAFVMWAIVADRGHLLGDVVGGALIAAAVAGAVALCGPRRIRPPTPAPRRGWLAGIVALAGAGGLLAIDDGVRTAHTALQPVMFLTAAVIGALALGLVLAFDRALSRCAPAPGPGAGRPSTKARMAGRTRRGSVSAGSPSPSRPR